ncbi:MAG: SURF1 family protein [Alphaproteobacteria bacterium]|nr:SURF1 family protein [Alphaproteobacteria bacterium]
MTGLRRPPFWASVFALMSVLILCGLGTWQLYRLSWKTGLLAQIEQAYDVDARIIPLHVKDFSSDLLLKRGYLDGRFVYDKTIRIGPRTRDGAVGVHLLTPFYVPGEDVYILVNRGWVALDAKDEDIRADEIQGAVRLVGALRQPLHENAFVPDNVPAKGQWYRMDLAQMSNYAGLPFAQNAVFYVEGCDGCHGGQFVHAVSSKLELPNNHLQYAIFWFSMAGVLVGVFAVRFLRNV